MSTDKYVFVDTWAWLALGNRKDAYHELARRGYLEIKANGYGLVTSDFIIDEVITSIFRNVDFDSAVQFVDLLFTAANNNQLKLERITSSRFNDAWSLRKKFQDKPYISFTDLTSVALMHELMIHKVFTGDSHFEQVDQEFEVIPKKN